MKRWQIEFIRWYSYSVEMVLLYVLLLPLYAILDGVQSILPFLLVAITSAIIYGGILYKTRSIVLSGIGIIAITSIGYFMGIDFFVALFLSVVMFWRAVYYYEGYDQANEFLLFLITILIGAFHYLFFPNPEVRAAILIVVFIQFLLTMGLKSISVAFHSTDNSDQRKYQLKWLGGILGVIGGASILLGFIFVLGEGLIGRFFQLLAMLGGLIAMPILYLISFIDVDFWIPEESQVIDVTAEGEQAERGIFELATEYSNMPFSIIAGILIAVALFFILRKFKRSKQKEVDLQSFRDERLYDVDHKTPSFLSAFRNRFTTKNEVRKLFYELEISLANDGFGRKFNQTVDDWLDGLNIDESLRNPISKTYKKVRYGDKDIELDERTTYKKAIKQVKKQLKKERQKT
ncbi:hypothetical protein QA612_00965 [Evansella sp. AB-P1]|uniref:hypothetical protein n=1 Tax=Evansella sp. AB-P1 TaxID=3037653 RepID=UPI00241F2645|nr:hypothetical protein [Evansella sp. AB-P1]MDG5786041.1 hypothetical protein [Evansella sp. AB-P1]